MRKTYLRLGLVTALMCLFAVNGFADVSAFDGVDQVVGGAHKAGTAALGSVMKWIVGLGIPIVCIFGLAFLGYTFAKKKAEQSQDGQNRIPVAVAVGAAIGFFVFIIVTAFIGLALMGDAGKGFDVVYKFWTDDVFGGI